MKHSTTFRRFMKRKVSVVAGIVVILLFLVALFGPFF